MSWKFISFKELFLFYVYKFFLPTCLCTHVPGVYGGLKVLDLELGVVINHHVGAGNRELLTRKLFI